MRRRDDFADMAGIIDLPIQAISTRPGFVDAVEPSVAIAELLQHGRDGIRCVADFSKEAGLASSPSIRDSDRDRLFVDIEAEVGAKLHLVRLLVHEDRRRIGEPSFHDLHIVRRTTCDPNHGPRSYRLTPCGYSRARRRGAYSATICMRRMRQSEFEAAAGSETMIVLTGALHKRLSMCRCLIVAEGGHGVA